MRRANRLLSVNVAGAMVLGSLLLAATPSQAAASACEALSTDAYQLVNPALRRICLPPAPQSGYIAQTMTALDNLKVRKVS